MKRSDVFRALAGHPHRFVLLTRATKGGEVLELEDAVLTFAGPGGPNGLFFLSETPDHSRALAAARRFFGERGVDYLVTLRTGIDRAAEATAAADGLRHVATVQVMALAPMNLPAFPDVPALEIREVKGVEGLDEYLRVGALGFEEEPNEQRPFYPPGVAHDPAFRFFVGYLDGEAVATGGLIQTPSGAGVYGVSTVPALRGRRIGTAMTVHVLRASERDLAFLQPSATSVRMYGRLGFETVGAYRLFSSSAQRST